MSKKDYGSTEEGQATPYVYEKREPIRVSFGVYIISLLVVALVIFVVMLVQYLPGYQKSYKLNQAVKNSDVVLKVEIPEKELASRDYNPTNKKFTDNIADAFKQMGARKVTVVITPLAQ